MNEIQHSIYGKNLVSYVAGRDRGYASAYDEIVDILTMGGEIPYEHAISSLSPFDVGILNAMKHGVGVRFEKDVTQQRKPSEKCLHVYVNSLGRVHVRPEHAPKPHYSSDDIFEDRGYILMDNAVYETALARYTEYCEHDKHLFHKIKQAMDALCSDGKHQDIVSDVTSHVQRVESICFYLNDKIFTMLERSENLVATKSDQGALTLLAKKRYEEWSDEEVLLVAALKALFISGRSVRYEEFNGMTMTATSLYKKLVDLAEMYRSVGCQIAISDRDTIFDIAQKVRQCTLESIGAKWLRYRWIFGLSFYKTEYMLKNTDSTETRFIYRDHFDDFYGLLLNMEPREGVSEAEYIRDIAQAVVARDIDGIECSLATDAATSWVEVFIEKIVSSAVLMTNSDYGMSSSLRSIARFLQPDESLLIKELHALKPVDFYTCFVANEMKRELDQETISMIAQSVQRRMMFNRWHFIPGNFEEHLISDKRHWYYPPLIPDIAVHSDVHREAHAKAMVKYSIRAPGPDMSQPQLKIGDKGYRGFYDVRVVRVRGVTFTEEDLLRTRRRTLWMGVLFDELVKALATKQAEEKLKISGFEVGRYGEAPDCISARAVKARSSANVRAN